MRYIIRGFVACVFVVCAFIAFAQILSVPVPSWSQKPIETPKQPHHVVYFWVCDDFIGALITTPIVWLDVEDGVPNEENLALMVSAFAADRITVVTHQHRGCPIKLAPEKTTRT